MSYAVTAEPPHRFLVLDGMRGIAALMVMATHAVFLFPLAAVAVDLFFGLSGFVLAYRYAGRLETAAQRRRFLVARFIRLEPLWLAGCALALPTAIGMAWFGWFDWGWGMLALSVLTAPFFVILPYMGTTTPLNPPGWSLAFELIANFVMLLVGPGARSAAVIAALAGPVFLYCIYRGDGGTTGFATWGSFPRVLFSFFLGVLLQHWWRVGALPRIQLPAALILVATALVCAVYTDWVRSYNALAVFVLNPLLLWLGAVSVVRGRMAAFCAWLGSISYGVYVLHASLIFSFEGLRFLLIGADVRSYQQSGMVGWLIIPLTVLLAHFLTKRFDIPARAFLKRRLLDHPYRAVLPIEPGGYAHWPQLDGLRTLAVLGVFYTHFVEDETIWGHAGVRLFFVLSGFLITGILLRGRDARDRGEGRPVRNFYIRRALRLWPAYYLLMLVALAANWLDIRDYAWWHLLYLSNILVAVQNSWEVPWITAHLWSLSVEEQFYLIWPPLMLLLPRRALAWLCIVAILVAVIGRVVVPWQLLAHTTLPTNSLDALAGGGLLALLHHRRGIPSWFPLIGIGAGAGILIALMLPSAWAMEAAKFLTVPLFAAVIALAIRDLRGPARWLLANPVSRYLGRVSYGAYLYHLFVMGFMFSVLAPYSPLFQTRGWPLFVAGATITYGLATLSWFLVERPLNRRKDRYAYP